MTREQYLAVQATDPDYALARVVARAQLELAEALHRRREELGLGIGEAARRAGLASIRLEMIEEGDTSSLTEVLALLRVLELDLTLASDLRLIVQASASSGTDLQAAGVGAVERMAPVLDKRRLY